MAHKIKLHLVERRWLIALINIVITLYGGTHLLYWILRYFTGETMPLVALATNFIHLVWVPAVILLPIFLLWRKVWLALMVLPMASLFLMNYGWQYVIRPLQVPSNTPTIRILSFNTFEAWEDFEPTLRLIQETDADIVALQEVNERVAWHINEELRAIYPFISLHAEDHTGSGMAILSRYPIVSDRVWLVSRLQQKVWLDIEGQIVTLVNVHTKQTIFSGRYEIRSQEISYILEAAHQTDDTPTILVGDFNLTDQSEDYARIAEHFVDSHREAGWGMGYTFPEGRHFFDILIPTSIARIDYLFYRNHLQAVGSEVLGAVKGSDHRPLLVTLALVD